MQKKYRYRSAISGLTVTKEYALANPDITVRETVATEEPETEKDESETEENSNLKDA